MRIEIHVAAKGDRNKEILMVNKGQMYYELKKKKQCYSVPVYLRNQKNIYLYYKSFYMPFNCSENSYFFLFVLKESTT